MVAVAPCGAVGSSGAVRCGAVRVCGAAVQGCGAAEEHQWGPERHRHPAAPH